MVRKRIFMETHVCPWWLTFTFDNPLRRMFHDPDTILKDLIIPGQVVLDIGCGMGYFSLAMARMVGENGKVIAADLQEEMLQGVQRRAKSQALNSRIHLHRCLPDRIGLDEKVDFALAFWMVHEVPRQDLFFLEIATLLKPGGRFLLVEPKLHVSAAAYRQTLERAYAAGLKPVRGRKVSLSQADLFTVEAK